MPEADPHNIDAIERLAAACVQQGKLDEAARLLREVLDKKPGSPLSHLDLANVLYMLGRTEEAKAHYEAAIRLKPDYADAHYNLGVVLEALNQPSIAMVHYERALALKEDNARAHSNLGNILHTFGRFREAATHYERALLVEPDSPEILSNLGSTLNELGRHQEARARLEQALVRNPYLAEAHSNLALVLQTIGDHEQAIIRYKTALDLKPDSPEVHNNLGHSLQALDRWEEAIAQFQRALALRPDYAEAHVNLGRAQKASGRIAEARQCFEAAIALSPRRGSFYLNLTECKTFVTDDDPHLRAMEKLLTEDASLSPEERLELHFALGSAFADLAQHDLSFEHFRAGNALKRQQIVYKEAGVMARIDRVRAVFTPELMRARAGLGDPSAVPVFIVGMPRSGSTLVEQILAGHPSVFGAGELTYFEEVIQSVRSAGGAPFDYPEGVPELSSAILRGIGSRYQERLRRRAPTALRISDKLPSNWFFIGLIHLALPNARIIHVCRDAVDTCLSCFLLALSGHEWSYELGELGRYYRAYATTMAHWRAVLPPEAMLEVRYEDIVVDLERQARRILDHCGLAWDDACLDFHRVQRPVKTASAAQVRRPLYQSSVGRWRVHAERLGPLLDALGPDV
jgi:tetratricopeptide (TPR) repeat protein